MLVCFTSCFSESHVEKNLSVKLFLNYYAQYLFMVLYYRAVK